MSKAFDDLFINDTQAEQLRPAGKDRGMMTVYAARQIAKDLDYQVKASRIRSILNEAIKNGDIAGRKSPGGGRFYLYDLQAAREYVITHSRVVVLRETVEAEPNLICVVCGSDIDDDAVTFKTRHICDVCCSAGWRWHMSGRLLAPGMTAKDLTESEESK